MNRTTLDALAAFPQQLEAHFAMFPERYRNWAPPSWDGIAADNAHHQAAPAP